MRYFKWCLLISLSAAFIIGLGAMAALLSGFLVVEYDVYGSKVTETEMFLGNDIETAYQDAIPMYRSGAGVNPILNFGWFLCTDYKGIIANYTRWVSVRWGEKKKVENYYEVPINAIDIDPAGDTQCSEAMIFILNLKAGWWCPIDDEWCLPMITVEMRPFGTPQKIKLKEDVLTVNASLWQVYTDTHPVSEEGHFSLEQIARLADFYGIENDKIGNVAIKVKDTVDRIWGQCGIQFKLQEKWGRKASIDNNKYQMKEIESRAHPTGILSSTSAEFLSDARVGHFNDLSINIYLFPLPLSAGGTCASNIWGASYPRSMWYSSGLCSAGDDWCKGGDVFLTNDIECLKDYYVGADNERIYGRIARTIAHEIGHILLEDAGHPNCSSQASPDNLMVAKEECDLPGAGTGNILASQQCTNARANLSDELSYLLVD